MKDEAAEQASAKNGWIVTALIAAACILVRVIALGADPPEWLSWSRGLYTDEGFYSLDARHHVLFGGWAPGNFHDRLVSPLLTGLQILAFSAAGVTRLAARCVSVVCSLTTLALMWMALNRRAGRSAANAGMAFLGLVPVYALYNRMALQETPAALLLAGALACVAFAERSDRADESNCQPSARRAGVFWFLAGAFAAAVVTAKSLGLFALPGLLAAAFTASRNRSAARFLPFSFTEGQGRGACVLGLATVLGCYAAFWWLPHYQELSRMNRYYVTHQVMPHSVTMLLLNVRRFAIGGERGTLPFLLATSAVPFLLTVAAMANKHARRSSDVFAAVWLCSGLLCFAAINYAPSRYLVLIMPPMCYLAAVHWSRMRGSRQRAAMLAFAAVSMFWYVKTWTGLTWTEAHASRVLAEKASAGRLALGDMAPQLALGTMVRAAPFQAGLSNDVHPIETLRPDIVIVDRHPAWRGWWIQHEPGALLPGKYRGTVMVGPPSACVADLYRQ